MSNTPSYDWHEVDPADAFPFLNKKGDAIVQARVNGKKLCLVKTGEDLYACHAKCPHQGGPMAKGHINESGHIVCPWHRFAFDLETGKCPDSGFYLETYPLKKEGKRLLIGFPKKRFWGLF